MMGFENEEVEEVLEFHKKRDRRVVPRWKQTKSKLKEPIKPWTRKERFLVLTIFVVTTFISSFLAFSARSWKLPGLPEMKINGNSLFSVFWGKETIVLQKDDLDEKKKQRIIFIEEKSRDIIANFRGETKKFSGVYGFYLIDIESGFGFGINEKEIFDGASLVKLPVMAALCVAEENGSLSFNETYVLKNSDKVSGAGVLSNKPAGFEVNYGEILTLMGKKSDNTAFVIAKTKLGKEMIEKVLANSEMKNTDIETRETTPYDVGMFFLNLWRGKLVSEEKRDMILDSLTNTDFENYLPKGLPADVRIAHKFGTLNHIINDAGVVYTKNPYIIVVMSKGVIEREANAFIPSFSKVVYEALTGVN